MKLALLVVGLLVVLTACDRTSGIVELRRCYGPFKNGAAWHLDSLWSSSKMDTAVVRFVCVTPPAEKK